VSQHSANLSLAWPARQSDFKMMPNKPLFDLRLLSTELQVPACDRAEELSSIQFHFYTNSCWFVSGTPDRWNLGV